MFSKSYKLKSNAPIRGSDVRKFRLRLEKQFPNINPETLIPAKSNVTILKLSMHNGTQTCVYCVEKLPMFFEIDNNTLVPTVYMLWQVHDILCYMTTYANVLPRLNNGADLMCPGIVPLGTGRNAYGHFQKGQLMAINLTSNKEAVAVGKLARSSDDLFMSGGRGVAVTILHTIGDKLWGHEPSLIQQLPNTGSTHLMRFNDDDDVDNFPPLSSCTHSHNVKNLHNNTENVENAQIIKAETSLHVLEEERILANTLNKAHIEDDKAATHETAQPLLESNVDATTITSENILKNAFLAALKNHGKSLQLPLLTSTFYRSYVVPETNAVLDLKKTKYKKFSNFLNEMIDEGFLVIKQESKGVDKIVSIDFEHPVLVNFITDIKPGTIISNDETSNVQNHNPLFKTELTELYLITDVTAPLFTKLNYKRGEGIPVGKIRKVLRQYIDSQNFKIVEAQGKGMTDTKSYNLDETLEKICKFSVGTLSEISSAVIAEMEHSYQMCHVKDVLQTKPLIQMSLAMRAGNKKVTQISNIECYGIIMNEFVKLCKQGAAASTTIVTLPNQKREVLQIQGNQIRFIYNLLTGTYSIPPKCITGLELARTEKKNKKK